MSTPAIQAELSPTWKLEVNRRLAAHQRRKGFPIAEAAGTAEAHSGASGRAAQAAARVAARYANAPSYSQMLADEARSAMHAAEAASRAAQKAQAAVQSVLDGLEAVTAEEPGEAAAPATSQNTDRQGLAVRWNAELPVRATEPAPIRAMHGTGSGVIPVEKWLEPGFWDRDTNQEEEIEVVEPEQPIHANLIEFPRELVATRKVRPRRAEGPYATAEEPAGQLSIFEVDPGSISTQPAAADVAAEAAWTGPEWSGMQLDEEPRQEAAYPADNAENAATEADAATEPAAAPVQAAPINLRLMAAVVDGALITGAFLVAALVAAMNAKDMPSIHAAELIAAAGLTAIGALYLALFCTLAEATPGMRYAGIGLCTFDDQRPTRAQRSGRLGALLLSLLPVGLGLAWAIFDEEHLSWHDRLSRTYPRRG